MERAAGWFIILAALLMVAGLAYYLKVVAERKGWGIQKVNYQTSLLTAAGLNVGDPVKLMGFDVGEITRIEANKPYDPYAITVFFWIKKPYYGYLWSDSTVKASADFLGNRVLEVNKGYQGVPTIRETTNKIVIGILKRDYFEQRYNELISQTNDATYVFQTLNAMALKNPNNFYAPLTDRSLYWLYPAESATINERLEKLVNQVEAALPGITNQIAMVLTDAGRMSTNASALLTALQPAAANLSVITENIREPQGGLGEWLLPTNIHRHLEGTLSGANTNLPILAEDLDRMIENLASITGNLNAQVQTNSSILSSISKMVKDTDELVQGLKRHWFLRSAFKKGQTNK